MFRKVLLCLVFLGGALSLLPAQAPTVLPPEVRTGVLQNGVRYFIQKNGKPENRVELRLTVQVGSLQETESELGLAHLVEHLQFEGTERFGPQEIIHFLESNGMKFGNDLNAQTNFTDTQYFLDLPADQPEALKTGLMILEDWAHGPRITAEMLEKEKKIVAEEQRVRMENVQGRLTEFFLPVLLAGTPYADRLPIGKMPILQKVSVGDAEAFVRRWYTPEALSLQIVGDVDPASIEGLLKATFTKPFTTTSAPAPFPAVPGYRGASFHPFQDVELGANILVWNKVLPVDPFDLALVKKVDLLNFVVSFTLSKRFTELTQAADPPFLQASVGASPLFGRAWLNQFQVVVRDGVADRSVETYMNELRRLAVHGLTATDLQLALGEYRSLVEAQYAQRDNTTNPQRGGQLAAHALTGEPVLSDEQDYRLRLATAEAVTLAELNGQLSAWLDLSTARLLHLTTGKPEALVPDEAGIQAIAARVEAATLEASQQREIKALFPSLPAAGKITKTEKVAGTPLTKWTLSNGLAVYLYPNSFTKNEVQLRATARGGLARASDADYLSAVLAPYLFGNTGLGDLSLPEVTDFLTGHQAGANVGLDDAGSALTASAVPADLEVMFQLVNKKFSAVRRDAAVEASFLQQVKESLTNQQDLPEQKYQNEIQRILGGAAPRSRPLTAERMGEVVPDRAAQLYAEAFGAASGYTFTITGDFDEATLKPLVETYLASLPAKKAAGWKDLGIRPLAGPLTSVVKAGRDNKAVVTLFLPVSLPYSTQAAFNAQVLQEILDIRLREVVRQDKEGTYGVTVSVSLTPYPYPHALTQVNFTCDRARQDELQAAVITELQALASGKIDDTVFAKAIEIRRKALETDQKTNNWWLWAVSSALNDGDDLKLLPTLGTYYGGLKKAAIVAQAKVLLDPKKALVVVLNPED